MIEGTVCADYVHLCVAILPKYSVSSFVEYLKGKSTLMIFDAHSELVNKWDRTFWARGYYVAIVGNITEDALKKYIQEQEDDSKKE